MRIWHLVGLTAGSAVVFTLARDPLTRVFLFVFATGLGEVYLGLAAVMSLFRTIGALGEARGLLEHAEALAATTAVVVVGTAVMSAWLFVGFYLVWAFT